MNLIQRVGGGHRAVPPVTYHLPAVKFDRFKQQFGGGGTSYIVFRPEQIHILDVTPWRLP